MHGRKVSLILSAEEKAAILAQGLPLPPSKPLDSECCDNGCEPCIFDWYDQKIQLWCKKALMVWPEGKGIVQELLRERGMNEDQLK